MAQDVHNMDQAERKLSLETATSSPVLKAVRTVPVEKAASLETLIRGSWAPNAVYSLCRLGVPDALSDDPAAATSAADLATRLQCSGPCLLRLLRLCAAYGLLVEVDHTGKDETVEEYRAAAAVGGGSSPLGPGGHAGFATRGADADGAGSSGAAAPAYGRCTAAAAVTAGPDTAAAGGAPMRCDGDGGDLVMREEAGEQLLERAGGAGSSAAAGCPPAGKAPTPADAPRRAAAPVCRERQSGFYLTDMGLMLRESHPSQMRWLSLMLGLPGHYLSRGYLYDNVKEGRMGFEAAFGCDWYTYVASHPLEGTAFDKAMTATSAAAAQTVANAYDFSRHSTVVDVGGGQGLLMTAILHNHPGVQRGYVLELPNVVAAARRLGQRGLEKLHYVEADFFKPFPVSDVDCIVMRLVLHDWPDAEAAALLRHARGALASHGSARLVVVEAVLPELVTPGVGPATVQQLEFDMGMMLMTSGRERSLSEWETLLASAGFRIEAVMGPPQVKVTFLVAAPDRP
ncbi:hypothetical protein GPECTOR_17g853 [Gonium pectorale]|uniref:O-methyltransferase domain-containing protein n=1 Tax=Gonium pectorale TaxID=33097 RepID=A0A150GK54_GONPE|nr:hypothetical protein GPECTOR_17g853 [Gonium pectorale]|eukprot:KXZ50216.1 hypothetical protein GPECTOR_17g853 [Gonium pectorale]